MFTCVLELAGCHGVHLAAASDCSIRDHGNWIYI